MVAAGSSFFSRYSIDRSPSETVESSSRWATLLCANPIGLNPQNSIGELRLVTSGFYLKKSKKFRKSLVCEFFWQRLDVCKWGGRLCDLTANGSADIRIRIDPPLLLGKTGRNYRPIVLVLAIMYVGMKKTTCRVQFCALLPLRAVVNVNVFFSLAKIYSSIPLLRLLSLNCMLIWFSVLPQ